MSADAFVIGFAATSAKTRAGRALRFGTLIAPAGVPRSQYGLLHYKRRDVFH
jgi:hypothetical protein